MSHSRNALLTGLCLALSASALAGPGHTHEHGAATLSLAIDGEQVDAELVTPAANLLGFEHLPESAPEREALQKSVARLRDGAALLGFPAAARCSQETAQVESPLMVVYDDRDRERAAAPAPVADHADFTVGYRFTCTNPAALTTLELTLFEAFPGLERIAVAWVDETHQSLAVARPGKPRVELRQP